MSAGCSAVYILDQKGKLLISRNYRGDVAFNVAERFIAKILEEEELNLKPIVEEEGITYIYVKHSNLYFLAVTNRNANATMILLFLYKLIEVFKEYFKELEEESIRDNFVIIYELLDEMMDFGFPQSTESKILQEYITQESYKLDKAPRPPQAVTNAVSWRSEGIKYRKNEVFLDVVESINLLVNTNGTLLRSEIVGCIKMKSFLSGMPELRLVLNDRLLFEGTGRSFRGKAIEMEDVNFHQCVRLSRFENDRTISFVPPDGEFELMTYRLNTQIKPLIWIEPVIESHSSSKIEYMVKARSQFKQNSTANNVEISVPVPPDASAPQFKAGVGSIKYVPENDAIVWSIKQFQGGKEYLMRCSFGLPSVQNEENPATKPPITVKFEIPYFTVSGIQVRYLKIIEKSGYQALPWVRYITQSGDYQIRV
jgi:AP-1 complex subunit mu